jgi:hypothetical protein
MRLRSPTASSATVRLVAIVHGCVTALITVCIVPMLYTSIPDCWLNAVCPPGG